MVGFKVTFWKGLGMKMSKGCMISLGVGVVGLLFVIICICWGFGVVRGEVRLRNAITAKQEDNKNEMDGVWKKISQVAQVTDAQKNALIEIFERHAKARAGEGGQGGSVMSWIQESVPNVDTSTFNNLQNIISSSRDRFVMRQKELLDLKREHDNIIDMPPGSVICGMMGKQKIEVMIVTST